MKPLRVGLIGYDGVQGLDLIGPSDAFTIAAVEGENGKPEACYEVTVIGLTGKPFRAESGLLHPIHTDGLAKGLQGLSVPDIGGRVDAIFHRGVPRGQ